MSEDKALTEHNLAASYKSLNFTKLIISTRPNQNKQKLQWQSQIQQKQYLQYIKTKLIKHTQKEWWHEMRVKGALL